MQAEKLAINIDQQSVLARLLAQENIKVIHGAYKTAWFDPARRTLALPIWENKGKAVYDLLTGHEVGHALYTPAKGWHDAVDDIKGAPKAYLNILEDVRIERNIQDRYPGLRSQFQKAYKILADEDFFGLIKASSRGVNLNDMILIDRINIHYKIGAHAKVVFTKSEYEYVLRAYNTKTFDDVVALAKEIYAYQKSLRKQLPKTKPQPKILDEELLKDMVVVEDLSSNDYEKQEEETDADTNSSIVEDQPNEPEETEEVEESNIDGANNPETVNEESTEDEEDLKSSSNDVDDDKAETESAIEEPTDEIPEEEESADSYTDEQFRSNEGDLIADTGSIAIYTAASIRQTNIVIDYKTYYDSWKNELRNVMYNEYYKDKITSELLALNDDYKKFKTETEQAAAYMCKEFEMRKAAFQYSRSTVHKTGLLNTNKLHSYKTSDDLFLRSTKLANYKNHGMMLFIDFSGSMQSNIGATIRQTINLAAFCRMVNIPYEVYAFTTRVNTDDTPVDYDDYSDCELFMQKFNLLNLMSSRMKRSEHNEAQRMLWNLSRSWDSDGLCHQYISKWNHLHSTPLNTTILYADKLIKQFKAKHGIDKMTAMFLSDGDSDAFQVRLDDDVTNNRVNKTVSRHNECIVRALGKTLHCEAIHTSSVTVQLLKALKASADVTTLGFFISDYRNDAINKAIDGLPKKERSSIYMKMKTKYTSQMHENRVIVEDNIHGYDRYFGLCAKYMDVTEDTFATEVEDGASKHKIKTAFSKISKQKRINRILLNAFVDAIA